MTDTNTPIAVTQEDEELAQAVLGAADIVTCNDGYYEIDEEAVALAIARHRLTRPASEAEPAAGVMGVVDAMARAMMSVDGSGNYKGPLDRTALRDAEVAFATLAPKPNEAEAPLAGELEARAGQLGRWFAEYAEHHKSKAEAIEALPGSEAVAKVERNLERARFAYALQDDIADTIARLTAALRAPESPPAPARGDLVEALRKGLDLANTLSCDVPITHTARKHLELAYEALASLNNQTEGAGE